MIVLGIETSCDETGVALYCSQRGLLADVLYSQVALHAQFGGVVPELASRDHIRKLLPLTAQLLADNNMALAGVSALAYTAGPGLKGALLVGAGFATSLASALAIPCLGVHHLEGHLLSPMLEEDRPSFPFIALLVSGGHTQLVLVRGVGDYQLMGETLDDAAGEAFDKTAKCLGLGYPGGPALAQAALAGDAKRYRMPRPMTDRPGCDFSFSGLKTFVSNLWHQSDQSKAVRADIAASFQNAVVDTLLIKARRALQMTGLKQLVVAGGVSANKQLREDFSKAFEQDGGRVFFPRFQFCTDNGAMIALAGYHRLHAGEHDKHTMRVYPRWPLSMLKPPGVIARVLV